MMRKCQVRFLGGRDAATYALLPDNKCLRYWMDNEKVGKYDLNKYCAVLAAEFPFADELNSMARQAAAERAWSAIARFYDNCNRKIKGKKGYPKFVRCRKLSVNE